MNLPASNRKINIDIKPKTKKMVSGLSPSNYLLSAIKESKAERKRGDFYSFKSSQDAINFLDEI